ncbi:MAG: autotransporter domain-containing protein [Ferruginibacter sp.]
MKINVKERYTTLLAIALLCSSFSLAAQDTGRIYFTTAVGLLMPVSAFSKSYHQSLALNSGIEYRFRQYYFAQLVLDFNAINYSQQIRDDGSAFLFQHTSSSVVSIGVNAGRNFALTNNNRLFISPYLGIGYCNIGEPRLTVDNDAGIIKQEVKRMQGIFTRAGARMAFNTRSKLVQTIYIDAAYWSANIRVQASRPQALSLLVGTRIGF